MRRPNNPVEERALLQKIHELATRLGITDIQYQARWLGTWNSDCHTVDFEVDKSMHPDARLVQLTYSNVTDAMVQTCQTLRHFCGDPLAAQDDLGSIVPWFVEAFEQEHGEGSMFRHLQAWSPYAALSGAEV